MNCQRVGGKKRDMFYDDMWNMKYLKGFKWGHLKEKMEYDRKMREERLRVEVKRAKKEREGYEDKRQLAKRI